MTILRMKEKMGDTVAGMGFFASKMSAVTFHVLPERILLARHLQAKTGDIYVP